MPHDACKMLTCQHHDGELSRIAGECYTLLVIAPRIFPPGGVGASAFPLARECISEIWQPMAREINSSRSSACGGQSTDRQYSRCYFVHAMLFSASLPVSLICLRSSVVAFCPRCSVALILLIVLSAVVDTTNASHIIHYHFPACRE